MLADLLNTWTTDPVKRKWLLNYVPVLVSVLLICFIAWQLATLFWTLRAPVSDTLSLTPQPAGQTAGQALVASVQVDLNAIKQANLFGQFEVVSVESEEPVDDAPETTLQLNLHGTLLSNDPDQSRAIIEVSGKDTVFSIGDDIQNNVSLYSVLAYHVIINNRGKKEALRLPREDIGADLQKPGLAKRAAPRSTSASADRIAQQLRASAFTNPSSITDILRLKKGKTSSGQEGFRIYPGKERERFRELGLMPGDFVTQVNGMPIAQQNPFQIVQTLGSTSYINLSIERNGQPMNLSFDLGQTQ